jgi:hypothetical protein
MPLWTMQPAALPAVCITRCELYNSFIALLLQPAVHCSAQSWLLMAHLKQHSLETDISMG